MREVYAGAQAVIVATETGAKSQGSQVGEVLERIDLSISSQDQADDVLKMIEHDEVQSALEAFCNDKYWGRIWIVQEYAIGNNPHFLIGDSIVAAENLHRLLSLLDTRPRKERWDQAKAIYNIRTAYQLSQPYQLVQILDMTKRSRCEKRHDRVFGLMGLLPDALQYLLDPNYKTDLSTVTLAMTRAYIQKKSLNIILMAPHCHQNSSLPSWCPGFFEFDQSPPDNRVVSLIATTGVVVPSPNRSPPRNATGLSTAKISYRENTMETVGFRIGTIRSLGQAWTDTPQSGFPAHDPDWKREVRASTVRREFYEAVFTALPTLKLLFIGHCFIHAFHPSHGSMDADYAEEGLARWIYGNRDFFTGAASLQDHAKRQWHPIFIYGTTYYILSLELGLRNTDSTCRQRLWNPFIQMAESNMRLMCLGKGTHRIGWAATGARLHDEIFLIPGCNVPVILRRVAEGRYRLVGDAIVPGAMDNVLWLQHGEQNLRRIEIV